MSILSHLKKLNISNEEIVNLTDNEIIRIEKKLKAEVKMGGTLDINEVIAIVKLLRENKEELKLFLEEKFSWLRRIVTNPDELVVFPLTHAGLFKLDDTLKDFVYQNFETELTNYSVLCLYKNHYRALNSFLAYNQVIPDKIMEDIQVKMIQKLEYGIDCIEMTLSDLENKIEHIYNPFFFRCINFLESIHFEDHMNDLTNSLVDNMKKIKSLKRGLFSLGAFNSSNSELKDVISQNRHYSVESGVSEISNFKKFPKGGTKYSKFSGDGDFNSSNIIWIVIVVLFFAFRIGNTCNKASKPTYKFNEVKITEMLESQALYNSKISSFRRDAINMQEKHSDFIEEIEIEFIDNNISLKSSIAAVMSSDNSTEIFNQTDQPVLFVFEVITGTKYFSIKPNKSVVTNNLFKKFVIYTGKKPVKIFYTIESGVLKEGFKFKEFSQKDRDRLLLTIDNSNYNNAKKDYEIIITQEAVKINEK